MAMRDLSRIHEAIINNPEGGECVRDKSRGRHVLGGLYLVSWFTHARVWLTLLLLLDSWLLLPVGCVNKIHNPNNIIHRCQLDHI